MPRRRSREKTGSDSSGPTRPLRRALLQFGARCVLAVVIVGLATFLVARSISERIAIEDARGRGEAFARGVAVPLVNERLRAGDPEALARFQQVMSNRLRGGSIAHMKLWDVDGTVLWSDEKPMVGRRFPFDADVKALVGTSFVHAELSDLSKPENRLEGASGRLLEVYVGATDTDGRPLVFETYWSTEGLHADERAILRLVAPLSLGALLLLLVMTLPLGVVLARRSTQAIRDRNLMLNHALSAADLERRRVSQVLHDRVIQDLAGIGYALPTAVRQLSEVPAAAAAREILDRAAELVREDVTALRTMLVDIYPPSLAMGGLSPAIHELAARAEGSGLVVSVKIETADEPELAASQLIFRIVREGLLNVVAHAGATRAWVHVTVTEQRIDVSVRDNGSGPAGGAVSHHEDGHVGLRLLRDTVADVGGDLALRASLEGEGTVLKGWFPPP